MMTIKEIKIQLALGTLPRDIGWTLAKNPTTPAEILAKLSKDEYWGIRFYVACHPNTAKETLTILLTDKDQTVSSQADIRLHLPAYAQMYYDH